MPAGAAGGEPGRVSDQVLELLQQVVTSPWVYALLFALAAVDAVLPAVPSETAVIAAAAFAASTGEPSLLLVAAAAALGALAGDHASYALGRRAGPGGLRRLRGGRRARAVDAVTGLLARRGGALLVTSRFVPGGRTATTLALGATGFPARRFTGWAVLAAVTWAAFSVGVGFAGGLAFEERPLLAVATGVGFALLLAAGLEVASRVRPPRGDAAAGGVPVRAAGSDGAAATGRPAR